MAYFIKEFEPSFEIRGPFKTITEARKRAMGARFADGAHICKGTDKLCAYDPRAEVGDVGHTYSGYKWLWVYEDASGKAYVLNRDGTLGRRYRLWPRCAIPRRSTTTSTTT